VSNATSDLTGVAGHAFFVIDKDFFHFYPFLFSMSSQRGGIEWASGQGAKFKNYVFYLIYPSYNRKNSKCNATEQILMA